MTGCARQPTDKRRTWAGVVAALAVVALGPGCLGGWTGGWSSADKCSVDVPPCSDEPLAYEQESAQGPSAEELVAEYGGSYRGTSSTVSEAFWTATDLVAPSSPVPIELEMTYTDGNALENQCTPSLSVEVEVNVRLGDGLAEWHVPAELELVSGAVTLSAVLPASGTRSSVDLALSVEFGKETTAVLVRPVNGPAEAVATFLLE